MNDVGLDGSVEGGAVGNGGRPGHLGIRAGGSLLDGFSEGLEPSLEWLGYAPRCGWICGRL